MSYRLQLEKNFTKHYAKLTAKERGEYYAPIGA